MTDEADISVHGLKIESIISGMNDAIETESQAVQRLALRVGATALEHLLQQYRHTSNILNQCLKATSEDGPEL